MPICFSTQAANADRLCEDDAPSPKDAARALPEHKSSSSPEDVKAATDINVPDFLKDKETPTS